ncbi:uncharacterized protein [Antedon mediterranea]|uniref:uncharacterized protein isoform X2 n=1 Tax=Antedon mediterranea TaxID=105859 RepID=UPI003AF61B3D
MRQRQNDLIGDYFESTMEMLCFRSETSPDGIELRSTPTVKLKNIKKVVFSYLDEHSRLNNLSPNNNEVWIKFGGDKGGGSTKFEVQICSLAKPNSINNIIVVLIFDAPDMMFNINRTLPEVAHQVVALNGEKWRNYTLRVFCFGDYEYLTKLYGLNGPNARYCCLFCEKPKAEMQLKAPPAKQRSLASIRANYRMFMEDGGIESRSKDVSMSVVNNPLVSIEVDHVSVPSLHLSLGIFKKLFDMLETEAHSIDCLIYSLRKNGELDDTSESKFDKIIQHQIQTQIDIKEKIEEKKLKLTEMEDAMPLIYLKGSVDGSIITNVGKIVKLREEIESLTKCMENGLPFGTGPIVTSLERVLQKNRIQRQAYHGKSFIGNHVHKCCQDHVRNELVNAPLHEMKIQEAEIPIGKIQLIDKRVKELVTKYDALLSKFSRVHNNLNHSKPVTDVDIQGNDEAIKDFMEEYRKTNKSISPKLHMLEEHVIPQLKAWRFGLGLVSEQGGESIHAALNKRKRTVAGMHDRLGQLTSMMRSHAITTQPCIIEEIVEPKRRKIEKEE